MYDTYNYVDEIINTFREYNPIFHNNDNYYNIEINNNNGDNIIIDLDSDITVSFGKWHNHYYYEDRYDYEVAMEKVKNLINNEDCILNIYSNNKYLGSGSSFHRKTFSERDAVNFINTFFKNTSFSDYFREHGITIKVCYWDNTKNYDLLLEKDCFR